MSVLFTLNITCNGCGEKLVIPDQAKGTHWRANYFATIHHWVVLERNVLCVEHFCPVCSDAVIFNRKPQTAKGNWNT